MLEEQKPKWIPFAIGGVIVVVVLVVFMLSLFSGRGKPQPTETLTPPPSATDPGALKPASSRVATTSKDLVQVIDKDSILRSTDAGDEFSPYFKIATTTTKNSFANVITINFHPLKQDNIIVTSYEDGLFNKTPEKDSWDIITFPPQKIYSFVLDKSDPDKKMFVSGVVDNNGRVFRTKDGGETWKAVYVEPGSGTTITALAQDPRILSIIYSGTSNGTIIKSIDGGNTWRNIGSKIDGQIRFFNFDSIQKSVIYLLSFQQRVYYSANRGEIWIDWEKEKEDDVRRLRDRASESAKKGDQVASNSLNEQAKALEERNRKNKMPSGINLIVADPRISGTIYAGNNGGLYRSKDFGKYWDELDIIESARSYPIRSIAVNPRNSKEVVFVAGKAFYKTENAGLTWSVTPLSSDRNASFVAYDPYNVAKIYIGVSSI